ncbi:MAG: 30S ribosomal protein S17 [Chloroflexi bacterium]|nr:30S ribosomal protein S17 [Chloroflexota bacterium]
METKHKSKVGRVVSNKMQKTVVVAVDTARHHPLYRKTLRRIVKYKADTGGRECGMGDIVRIVETRPISKDKRWRVAEIVTKKEAAVIQPTEVT